MEPPVSGNFDARRHLEALRAHLSSSERDTLDRVFAISVRAHAGQFRTAETEPIATPYIMHPLRVARILADEWQRFDLRTLVTCLLHDTLEDCPRDQRGAYEQDIIREAGAEVYHAVETLTKPMAGPREVQAAREARYFAELRKSGEWVRLVKLADRVDNLRDALAWGNVEFWTRYSNETIGWHLFLARGTSPLAEEALFRALVEGERALRGRPPVWADGYLIDPRAAALIPEHIARAHEIIGMALQGETLIVGVRDKNNALALNAARMVAGGEVKSVFPVQISADAMQDALLAELFGKVSC